MLTVHYEDVVADVRGQARRLLQHCELDWDERCLRFHENARASTTASALQVRQPLYDTSVGKWRHVAQQLEPARAILVHCRHRDTLTLHAPAPSKGGDNRRGCPRMDCGTGGDCCGRS